MNPGTEKYDPNIQKPVLRCSICTGEQVAGFKDLHTGKFTDIMLIRNEKDLEAFKEQYGVTELTKEF
ncbi:MAG: aspartate dehydrogenase [Dorea sp.]|nr:aspartate dehydrogenase [Dorea sp.]